MVKINPIKLLGHGAPLMHKHELKVVKQAPTFNPGESVTCYITRYDNARFAVFSSSGVQNTKYHVFESEGELHEHFEEL